MYQKLQSSWARVQHAENEAAKKDKNDPFKLKSEVDRLQAELAGAKKQSLEEFRKLYEEMNVQKGGGNSKSKGKGGGRGKGGSASSSHTVWNAGAWSTASGKKKNKPRKNKQGKGKGKGR